MTDKKAALITGGGGGIGGAMARAVAARGISVAIADLDGDAAERVAAEIVAANGSGSAIGFAMDVAIEADCIASVARTEEAFGTCDILFNNAGIGVSSLRPDGERNLPSIQEVTPEVLERFLSINLIGAYNMIRAATPGMTERGWGRVINNTTSFITMLRVWPYGPLKAAFESASAVWAKELEGSGVTVNVLVPGGPVDTNFVAQDSGMDRALMMQPEVMGPPAAWLASSDSDGITGKRYIAGFWDADRPEREAALEAGAPIGWPELGIATRIWPGQPRGKGPGEGL